MDKNLFENYKLKCLITIELKRKNKVLNMSSKN